jgi:peroxiredoxin
MMVRMGNELRPSGNIAYLLILFLLATMMSMAGRTAHSGTEPASSASAGETEWIDFTLQDANGKDVSLSRFIGKKPVLLAFWATWCPPCHEAVPLLNRMHTESPASGGIQILALDFMESRKKAKAFIKKKQVTYPVLLDRKGQVARKYRVVGIPTYILIDRKGKVVYRGHDTPSVGKHLE